MTEMIDQVSKAIAPEVLEIHPDKLGNFPDDWNGWSVDRCRDIARTAIEAMREPTSEMLEAGELGQSGCPAPNNPGPPSEVWDAMLDKALEEDG